MNRLLVTGATGNVGRHVVDQLTAVGVPFRAMTRDPDAARLPAHVDVVRGDLTVPESLDSCLHEIDTVFMVWVAPPEAIEGDARENREACAADRVPHRASQDTASILSATQPLAGDRRTHGTVD